MYHFDTLSPFYYVAGGVQSLYHLFVSHVPLNVRILGKHRSRVFIMDRSRGWLLAMTKPKMEAHARDHLLRQEFEVYLPVWVDLKKQRGVWQRMEVPMFPRYLFVRPTSSEQSIAPIRSTHGVSQLVRFGTEPAMASQELIAEIRGLETARLGVGQSLTPFKKGQRVKVTRGPFYGVSAEVLSCDQERVILLLQILGKAQRLAFDSSLCRAD